MAQFFLRTKRPFEPERTQCVREFTKTKSWPVVMQWVKPLYIFAQKIMYAYVSGYRMCVCVCV